MASNESINKRLSEELEQAKSDIQSLRDLNSFKDNEIKEAAKWKEQVRVLRDENASLQQTIASGKDALDKANALIARAKTCLDNNKQLTAANEQLTEKLKDQEQLALTRLNEVQSLKSQLESIRIEKDRLQEEKLNLEKQIKREQQEQNAVLVKKASEYQELVELKDRLADENRRLRDQPPVPPPNSVPGKNLADETQEQLQKELVQKDQEIQRLQYQLDQTRLLYEDRLNRAQGTAAQLTLRVSEQENRYRELQESLISERNSRLEQSPIGSFISVIPPATDRGNGQPTVIVNSRGPTRARITERAAQSSLQRLKERVDEYRRSASELIRTRDTNNNQNARYIATQLNAIQMLFMQAYGGEIVDRQGAEGAITWRFEIAEDGLQAARELPSIGFSDVRVLDISPSERGRLVQVTPLGSTSDIRYSTPALVRELRSLNDEQILERANKELSEYSRDARQKAIRVIGESLQSLAIIFSDNGTAINEMTFSTAELAKRASFLLNRIGVPTRPIQTDLDSNTFRVMIGK